VTVEAFFAEYEKTISALGAISTLAAVIVSLWLAGRAEKTRLKAHVSGTMIVHESIDPNKRPKFVSVNITNLGTMPFRIQFSFFYWRVPFCKESWLISPLDFFAVTPMVPQRKYPVTIEAKHSESIFLSDKATFQSEMAKSFQRLSWFPVLRAYFIKAMICTDDGTTCEARISKDLKKEIITLVKR
jgi:hypothetical protein